MRILGIVLAVALLSACGCKSGDKSGNGTLGNGNGNGKPQTTHTAAECDGLTDAIATLYERVHKTELAEALARDPNLPAEAPEARALREQEARDNLAMVLADCRKDPNRVVPCAKTAVSVDQLERACLLPLDDEGNAEQQQFGR